MSELAALESAFGSTSAARKLLDASVPTSEVTDRYERRLRSLLRAEQGKYEQALGGSHGYPSDSEACLAVVDAMVARHFTDGEIWRTLKGSALYVTRSERKGEKHARDLFAAEIVKARQVVAPFREDPGAERRQVRVVTATAATGAVLDDVPPQRAAPPPLVLPTGDDFVSCYVRHAAQRTDAPLEAHELMAMLILSSLAGPHVRLPIATSRHGWNLCLWGMYVVNSTVGRKSTSINLAKEVLVSVLGPRSVIEWEGSPQGLLQRLMDVDGGTAVFARDEYSGLMAQMNRGGHMSGLPQLFIKAYDGSVLENIRTKKKTTKYGPKEEDTDRVNNPYLTKMTAAPWDALIERCTIDNVLDGFLARFIFVTGSAEPRPAPLLTAALETEFEELIVRAHGYRNKCAELGQIRLDDAVVGLQWQLEQEWLREARESSHSDAAGASLKRLAESALKSAALFAIDDTMPGTVPTVAVHHFERALSMAERWKVSTLNLVEALGATQFMRETDAVLQSVRSHSAGIQVSDLMRRHRRLRKRDFDEVLETLQIRKEIELVELKTGGRGRPPQVAYPFGHAPGGPA